MTIGEMLRAIAHEYDNVEVTPHIWHTVKFSVRTDSNGLAWADNLVLREDDHDASET